MTSKTEADILVAACKIIEREKLALFYDADGWNVHDPLHREYWCSGESSMLEAMRGVVEVATRQPNSPRGVR